MRFRFLNYVALHLILMQNAFLWAQEIPKVENLPAPIKAMEAQGIHIMNTFEVPNGLKGYAALYNGQGVGLYLLPDNEHVIVGNLFDATGKDLTEAILETSVYDPLSKMMWARLEKSTWIKDGDDQAKRVIYMFIDPNCAYCNEFWHYARPWVYSGKIQVRHILVGMLADDSLGKAAALLSDSDPQKALKLHEQAGKSSSLKPLETIPVDIEKKLSDNLALMKELGAIATPAIFYQNDKHRLQQQLGLPNTNALKAIMGSE